MQFSYVALNSKYQKVTGTIDASDAKSAKEELHTMGLSVLQIDMGKDSHDLESQKETKKSPQPKGTETFWFLVLDEDNKRTTGTIDAENRKTACRRLVSEYKFQVLSLCSVSIAEDKREEEGKNGLTELIKQIELEFGISMEREITQNEDINTATVDVNFEKQKKEILQQVEVVTKKGEEILAKYKDRISGEQFRSIKNNIDTLMRMKLSNNISYMQQLSEELLTSIQQILSQSQSTAIEDEGYDRSNTAGDTKQKIDGLEEDFQEVMQSQIHKKSAVNAMNLSQLKSISNRLTKIAKTSSESFFPTGKNTSPEKQNFFWYSLYYTKLFFDALFTLRSDVRKQKWSHIHEISLKRKQEKGLPSISTPAFDFAKAFQIVLSELRLFLGWLLGFYVLFFFFAEYSFLKGSSLLSPFFQNLFSTPFLFFFTAFLFFTSFGLSIWHYFLKGRHFLFFLSSIGCFSLFLLFIVNF